MRLAKALRSASPLPERASRVSAITPVRSDDAPRVREQIVNAAAAAPAVLIVDDDAAARQALAASLDGLGARIVCAPSGEKALALVLHDAFAVVLLDLTLPDIDGFEVARLMRGHERSRATPIIVVTARDRDRRTTLAGHESGAVDVLYKPLDLDLVRARLAVYLELHRLRGESANSAHGRETNERLRATVAELEDARRRAEESQRAAEESQRAKDQFLATMSHEIRTPINAIIGYAQVIELGLAGPISDQQRAYLARLTSSSHHLLDLVSDVLDLSKIEAAEMVVARDPTWTGPIVAASLELVASQAAARGVSLIDARPGESGEPFVGDERRVRQIVVNLLSNAVKFTKAGGTITVTCSRSLDAPSGSILHGGGPWTCVRVCDTGIGIAPKDQTSLFEPFHQVEAGHTRTHGGTGLGLAISRRLARLMGGDLTMTSAPEDGSTFTLWLPAAAIDESAEARNARALPMPLGSGLRRLSEVGEALRDEVQSAVSSYSTRLRSDPSTPQAAALRQPDLEDHAVTLLADIAQSLIILEEAEEKAADLLKDSTEIQRVVAERHGARRLHQGWTEASVARDFAVLQDEAERVIRERIGTQASASQQVFTVIERLIQRACDNSLRSWREAAQRGG